MGAPVRKARRESGGRIRSRRQEDAGRRQRSGRGMSEVKVKPEAWSQVRSPLSASCFLPSALLPSAFCLLTSLPGQQAVDHSSDVIDEVRVRVESTTRLNRQLSLLIEDDDSRKLA